MEGETTEVWFPNEYEFCGEPIYAQRSLRQLAVDTNNNDDNDNDNDGSDNERTPSTTAVE